MVQIFELNAQAVFVTLEKLSEHRTELGSLIGIREGFPVLAARASEDDHDGGTELPAELSELLSPEVGESTDPLFRGGGLRGGSSLLRAGGQSLLELLLVELPVDPGLTGIGLVDLIVSEVISIPAFATSCTSYIHDSLTLNFHYYFH